MSELPPVPPTGGKPVRPSLSHFCRTFNMPIADHEVNRLTRSLRTEADMRILCMFGKVATASPRCPNAVRIGRFTYSGDRLRSLYLEQALCGIGAVAPGCERAAPGYDNASPTQACSRSRRMCDIFRPFIRDAILLAIHHGLRAQPELNALAPVLAQVAADPFLHLVDDPNRLIPLLANELASEGALRTTTVHALRMIFYKLDSSMEPHVSGTLMGLWNAARV